MMRDQTEAALGALIGLPVWDHHRVLDLQVFHLGGKRSVTSRFGPRKGQTAVVGEIALHVQCAWRIVSAAGIVVGSRDLYEKSISAATIADNDWDWNNAGANRRDERVAAWFAERAYTVESIRGDDLGGFVLRMSGDSTLEVFPDASLDTESWRLLRPGENDEHFVVVGSGIEG